MFLSKSPFLPDHRLVVEVLQRRKYRQLQAREEEGFVRQWFLLCGPAPKESLLNPQPASLRKLLPPNDRIWADPFLWKRGEDFFLFCEEWPYNQPHGYIAVMQLPRTEQMESPVAKPVLTRPFHLSYPFLFEHEGELYMLPEGGSGGAIVAYKCEAFPGAWRHQATLMGNVRYTDATLLHHQGKWWLFLTIKRGLFARARDLFVFWADSPLADKWTAHPANPVVRSLRSARPAGRVFELGGKLFRPSQNCLVCYGYSLCINEIVRLDTRHYEERLVTEVRPDWEPGIRANHHIDWHDGLLAMDAQRLLPAAQIST